MDTNTKTPDSFVYNNVFHDLLSYIILFLDFGLSNEKKNVYLR